MEKATNHESFEGNEDDFQHFKIPITSMQLEICVIMSNLRELTKKAFNRTMDFKNHVRVGIFIEVTILRR